MSRRKKIERALFNFMFVQNGILMSIEEALRHGEPVRLYGSDIPLIAEQIGEALDAR